jgi:hypothetical protein
MDDRGFAAIRSDIFSCVGHQWSFRLYPRYKSNDFLMFVVRSKLGSQIDVSCEIYLKNSLGEIIFKWSSPDMDISFDGLEGFGNVLKKSYLKGETTLVFEIRIRPTPKYYNYSKYTQPRNTFSENI